MRWREDYFPFTEPSFELDIFFNGDWMEVLGCGVIHDEVMANAGECQVILNYPCYVCLYLLCVFITLLSFLFMLSVSFVSFYIVFDILLSV